MGQTRPALQTGVEKELKMKIDKAQNTLCELQEALKLVECNSAKAKTQINTAAEHLQESINARKLELLKEIDNLSQAQIQKIQEDIKSTYLTLGSFQSTLSHLDRFDNGQLARLSIPDVNSQKPEALQNLVIKTDTQEITQILQNTWRMVNPATQITSVSKDVVASGSNDQHMKSSLEKWDLKQWLANLKPEGEQDDFEMICDDGEKSSTVSNESFSYVADEAVTKGDDEDSSICCIDKEESEVDIEDLNKWLTRSKTPSMITSDSNESKCQVPCQKSCQPEQNRFKDIPCLRLDPGCWIQKTGVCKRPNICLNMSQKEIIPPTYGLPTAFWLKKY